MILHSIRTVRSARYVLAGAVSFVTDIGIFTLVASLGGVPAISFALATAGGTLTSFVISRWFVFRQSRNDFLGRQLIRFMALSGFLIVVNYALGAGISIFSSDWDLPLLAFVRISVLLAGFLAKYFLLIQLDFR